MKKNIRFDGAKLRKFRKSLNLTQYDLAPMVGISQNRVSDIERNVTDPTPEEIEKFTSSLKMKTSDFLSDEKDIVVIENTFTKKKKVDDEKQHFEDVKNDRSPEQLELFVDDAMIGRDLTGYVLLSHNTYQELLDSKDRLQQLQSLLK